MIMAHIGGIDRLVEAFSKFYYSDKLFPTIWAVLIVALAAAIVYFIDGLRKYAYWLKKDTQAK